MSDTGQTPEPAVDEESDAPQVTIFGRLRGYFLAGILVSAPIIITLYLTWVFLTFVDSKVTGLIPEHFYPRTTVPGLGVVTAVLFFVLVGWLATNFLGRVVIFVSEYIVHRMPVIRSIYSAVKQIFVTVMSTKSTAFREVVLVEFPREGVWSIGFVTGTSQGEVRRTLVDEDMVAVFVPTTPNPTSGFLMYIPRGDLRFMQMSVEEALKLIVSIGIIAPPDPGEKPAGKRKRLT